MDGKEAPELDNLIARFRELRRPTTRRSAAIRALSDELTAAYHVGFTRMEIWKVLVAQGYMGSYAQFARSFARILAGLEQPAAKVSMGFYSSKGHDEGTPTIDYLQSTVKGEHNIHKEVETPWERIARQKKIREEIMRRTNSSEEPKELDVGFRQDPEK